MNKKSRITFVKNTQALLKKYKAELVETTNTSFVYCFNGKNGKFTLRLDNAENQIYAYNIFGRFDYHNKLTSMNTMKYNFHSAEPDCEWYLQEIISELGGIYQQFNLNIDIEQLKKQKQFILNSNINKSEIDGLLGIFDSIQDQLVDRYGHSEDEVFNFDEDQNKLPDTIYIGWSVEDVLSCAEERDYVINKEDALQILHDLDHNHDACYGISWDTIADKTWMYIDDQFVCTDPSCNQYRRNITETKFEFKEDRIINPETKETKEYKSIIDIEEYSTEQIIDDCASFGYDAKQVDKWLSEGEEFALIAECIFELES